MKKLFRSQMGCSIVLMLTIFLASCKQDVTVSPIVAAVEPQVENTKIVDLDIQGVSLQDGMLNFVDYEAMTKAKATIDGANFQSYKAFCEKIGFKSLALLDDEFTENLEKCQTEEEALALKTANQDIFDMSNKHPKLKNNCRHLLKILNRNSMFRAENALYRFDENGEIIVSNGDINSMNRAITDRKETDNVLVFNQAFAMLRTPCGLLNGSGWQYAQYNSDRRGFVSADLFYNFYTRRTGYITVETVYKTECRAEKRSIFGWWYDYQTDNVLKITEVKIKIPSPWPASWGIKPIEKFYLNRMICTSNAKSVSFTDLVNSETVPSDRINRNVKPNFEYVDVSYTNRGGVSIDYRCDN